MEFTKVEEQGVLLCLIIKRIDKSTQTEFFTKPEDILQAGVIHLSSRRHVLRHRHSDLQRMTIGTSEVLLVIKGDVTLQVFSLQSDSIVETIHLGVGDLVVLIAGGHSFSSELESCMLEVKNGPYDPLIDKVYF